MGKHSSIILGCVVTSLFIIFLSIIKPVVSQSDEWISVFYQNYSQMSVVPNIAPYSWTYPQSETLLSVTKASDSVEISRGTGGSSMGMGYVFGMVPTLKSRYTMEVRLSDGSFSCYMGGCVFSVAESNGWISVAGQSQQTDTVTIIVETDSSTRKCEVYNGAQGPTTLSWMDQTDYHTNFYTPDSIGIRPSAGTTVSLLGVSQKVLAPNLVTAIGNNKLQGFGDDGPRTGAVENGFDKLTSLGMGGTIFADTDYISPTSAAYYQSLLDADTGWDLGIHFTENYNGYDWPEVQDTLIAEYNEVATLFNGEQPKSWCMLGVGKFSDPSKNEWVTNHFGIPERGNLQESHIFGSLDMVDETWEYWKASSESGYSTFPLYAHNIDFQTNDSSVNIDVDSFNYWIDHHVNNGVRIVGFNVWHQTQDNQVDATFQTSISGTDTIITANTNGYNTLVLVKILASTVNALTNNGQSVDYSTSPEGYIIFEVENSEDYIVSTGTVPTTSTTISVTTSTSLTSTTQPSISTVDFGGKLVDHNSNPVQSEITIYEKDTGNMIYTQESEQSGDYSINTEPGMYDIKYEMTDPEFYIPNFFVKIMSLNVSTNMMDILRRITSYTSNKKISLTLDIDEEQVIHTHSPTKPQRILYNSIELEEIGSISDLSENTWFYDSLSDIVYMNIDPYTTPTTTSTTTTIITTTTTTVIPSSHTHTVQVLGPSQYLTTYSDGTLIYSNTAYEAIQNAIDSVKVKYGDTIIIKSGNYPLNSGLTGRNGINLKGEDQTVLDVSDLSVSSVIMNTAGSKIATVHPVNTFNKGQTTITTSTNLGANIDDLIFIWSTDVWHSNSAELKQGEIRRVIAVNGNTLTLEAPLEDTYLQSSTSVSLIDPIKDITIDGIKFLNTLNAWDTYHAGGPVQQKLFRGLVFEYGDNIRITNCHFEGIENTGIEFRSVIDSRIDHNIFEKATMNGAGYGVDIAYASQNILIDNNEAYNCRHWVVAADTSTLSGVPRHITVQYNYAKDSKYWISSSGTWGVQNQYDCHPVGEHIHFLYNEAEGSGYGLNYMGYSGDIIGNNFHDLGLYGIRIDLYGSVTEYQDEVIVQDNIITNTTAYGIWLGGSGRVAANIQLLDNTITDCPSVGILCSDTYDSIISSNSIVGSSTGIRLQTTTENIQGSGNDCTVLDEGINNNVS